MSMRVCVHMCYAASVQARDQLQGVSSPPPHAESWGLSSGHQGWHQPLPAEPSRQPTFWLIPGVRDLLHGPS